MFVFAPRSGGRMFGKAALGDMVFDATNQTQAAGSAAWKKTIQIRLEDSSGGLHEWFFGDVPISIADNSTAGTATIKDSATHARFERGRAYVTVCGNAATWASGEVVTLTVGSTTKILGASVANKAVTVTIS